MPFGEKPGPDGETVDFNRVYRELIGPALERAGLNAFRADEERRAGDIRVDMFQELLIADLVVVDITIDNPNVWYELGVRHALRSRGVVLISGGRASKAFDIYTDRKLRYSLADGGPDPATLDADIEALRDMIVATMESWHGRRISPVYQLIPSLIEPDWRSLRVGSFREFWAAYEDWEQRIVRASRRGYVGDLLVLADEAPVAAFRADAWIRAGNALRRVERFDFALEQLDKGLAIEPTNREGLREKGICLQRLARLGRSGVSADMARDHYRSMLQHAPDDAEIWALLGRVEKDAWVASWRLPASTPEQKRDDARYEDALLRTAIECYEKAYRADPKHYYSGINAVGLMAIYQYLNDSDEYQARIDTMAGAVRFAAECEEGVEQRYWAGATLGDLEVLFGSPRSVERAYKAAIAGNPDSRFALASVRSQLEMLQELGFAAKNVAAAIHVFERAMRHLPVSGEEWQPRRVFLFSGHMVDAPERETPRFPQSMVNRAGEHIDRLLRELGVGEGDLALTQGACGGDLLFTESCQALGARVDWLQPFDEPDFIRRSVVRCGESWRPRYLAARQALRSPPMSAPQVLGPPPGYADQGYAYERCNLWLLYTALAWGIEKVHFVCLWNGVGGDGRGGTSHMYDEVAQRTGQVHWIDTRTL
jgi:tetratricopeptide (TPR) repeat protein